LVEKAMDIKKLFLIVILLLAASPLCAAVRVIAHAPETVAQGEQFRLEYEVNTQDVKSAQVLTKIPGFEILYGPSRSSSYSVQIINGHQSSVSSVTYGYTLMARKPGTYVIPHITVNVDGHSYASNSVRIKVVPGGGGSSSGNASQGGSPQPVNSKSSVGHISNKDLFISVTANKSQVYEQEPILLTYRVYTRLNLRQLAGKMPDLKGFMVKEVPLPQQKSFSIGSYNGQNYYTTVWSQYVMFPQQTGKLVIPQIRFDGIVEFSNPNVDPIDAFFNGNSGAFERKKSVISPSLAVMVRPLPSKPVNFSGAVGHFSIKSQLRTLHPRENETLDLQVQISGTGNVDLIKVPSVNFPGDFDTYDPKQTSQSKLTTAGMVGNMTIDYVAVPKHRGSYTIPGIDFTYFDTSTNSYKTIHTAPINVDVAKGEKSIYSDKQKEILARSDINYIKTGVVNLHHKEDLFWNRSSFWLYYLISLLLFVAVFIYLHRRVVQRGDEVGQRVRGAGHLVLARMKKARKLMQQNHIDEFYDETLHAMMGYVSDKLNIPVSDLTKEKIVDEFLAQQVPGELSDHFTRLLSDCEFFRFSQNKNELNSTESVYNDVVDVISKLDSILKKKKK
jgi:hypothetical protein